MNAFTTPRSTNAVVREGTHSSSIGREAERPGVNGSSVRVKAGSNTCSPIFPARGEIPWSTALPERACVTGRNRAETPAGVNTTGSDPSGEFTILSAGSSRDWIDRTSAVTSSAVGRSAPS